MNVEDLWQAAARTWTYAGAVGGCMYILDGVVIPHVRGWLNRRMLARLVERGSGGAVPSSPVSVDYPATMPRPPRPHFVRLVCEQCGESVLYRVYPGRDESECAKGAERPHLRPVVSSRSLP